MPRSLSPPWKFSVPKVVHNGQYNQKTPFSGDTHGIAWVIYFGVIEIVDQNQIRATRHRATSFLNTTEKKVIQNGCVLPKNDGMPVILTIVHRSPGLISQQNMLAEKRIVKDPDLEFKKKGFFWHGCKNELNDRKWAIAPPHLHFCSVQKIKFFWHVEKFWFVDTARSRT